MERDVWRSREALSDDPDEHREIVHQFFRDLPEDAYPAFASMAAVMASGSPDERFEFGVDVLIAGVEALAGRG